MYIPNPIDTSKIKLPEDLMELTEILAQNVHEVWAEGRMQDGWTFAEVRDDEKKTTPCLVPYQDLPEREKDFDRNTAMQTLRLILSLGYKIQK